MDKLLFLLRTSTTSKPTTTTTTTTTSEVEDDSIVVDFAKLRRACWAGGIDEDGSVTVDYRRSRAWMLLLGHLPSRRSEWGKTLRTRRNAYDALIKDMNHPDLLIIASPTDYTVSPKNSSPPLSPPLSSTEQSLIRSVRMDVDRTATRLAFCRRSEHRDALVRMLYIYARVNPGIGYVQGMNNVALPIYLVLATRGGNSTSTFVNENLIDDIESPDAEIYAEHDSFFMFHEILTDNRDLFMREMDANIGSGMCAALDGLAATLRKVDPELAMSLSKANVRMAHFAFRWYATLGAQDLEMPDLLRLWDTMISDREAARRRARRESTMNSEPNSPLIMTSSIPPPGSGSPFLTRFFAVLVSTMRNDLLDKSFDEALQRLQRRPWTRFDVALTSTLRLFHDDDE
jgi:Rab-GTPase-TBC domain